MTGTGINTVRIGDEVKHITDLDALTLMHEWSKLKKKMQTCMAITVRLTGGGAALFFA
ncbi:hypothetical protein MS5797_54480 [Klebsiella pneumoniae]|jgi:DNA-binding transcriptional regulator YbjK|nr:hypothetical protein MS5797_54480 [Klebsiella pneumoniae]